MERIFVILLLLFGCNAKHLYIDLNSAESNYKLLPRFWTNSGFSPSAPLPFNRTQIIVELQSNDVYQNLEFVAALPNTGIKYIRIHWLLSLVEFKSFTAHKIPEYDFTALDKFMDHLMKIRLFPVIELMGELFPHQNRLHDTRFMWKDFVYQLVSHYLSRYGQWNLSQWRFELWNEPDLHSYNVLNYNFIEYMDYATGVADGLRAAARRTNPVVRFELRGPAGLFKSIEKHEFCWGLLNYCNLNLTQCPIDVITFHRKGIDSANDILINSIGLLDTFDKIYPNLKQLPYANSEADPSAGWSRNLTTNANVHYAHTLIKIVFQHWNGIFDGQLKNLESISHDNSFLSYHPFEFEQRTLLARFSMNETKPKTVQFIQKPVYAALGLLSSLASHSSRVYNEQNVSYVLSLSQSYAAVLLLSTENSMKTLRINISNWNMNQDVLKYAYFAEYLHINRTDPYSIWMKYNRPAYPNETIWNEMLHAQGPHVLKRPKLIKTKNSLRLKVKFQHPWIILVRICNTFAPLPEKIQNIRFRKIGENKMQIFWNDLNDSTFERCVRSYEIYYAPFNQTTDYNDQLQWLLITRNKHVPFLSFCHQLTSPNQRLEGNYKIRGVDIFGRYGEFSEIYKFNN